MQSRIIEETDVVYKTRVVAEREEVVTSLNAANKVVEREIAEHGLSKDLFEWSRERTYEADADIARPIPRKRWLQVMGNIKLGIPSVRSN